MATAKLTSKGQLTIPKSVRDAMGIGPGDRVTFVPEANGRFTLVPATGSVMALKGILRSPFDRPVTLEEMDEGIAEAVTERMKRCDRN